MLKKNLYTILFLGWVACVTMLSLMSFRGLGLDTGTLDIPFADKITHFVFYFVFVVLGSMFVRERGKGRVSLNRATWWVLFIAVGYGIIIEGLQYTLTRDRMMELWDMISNTLGALAGMVAIRWSFSGEKQLNW